MATPAALATSWIVCLRMHCPPVCAAGEHHTPMTTLSIFPCSVGRSVMTVRDRVRDTNVCRSLLGHAGGAIGDCHGFLEHFAGSSVIADIRMRGGERAERARLELRIVHAPHGCQGN